jgi:hypothetical protein
VFWYYEGVKNQPSSNLDRGGNACPSDSLVLYVDGRSYVVEGENLYKALLPLPEK